MIEVCGLTIEGFLQDAAFEIPDGKTCKIVTENDLGKKLFLFTLAGLRQPERGAIRLLGTDIYTLADARPVVLSREVSVVWRGGGLISNLRVWENITLPSEYHFGLTPQELEEQVNLLISSLGGASGGLRSKMSNLPADLLGYELTAAGLVRAMLMEPHLLIYDSILEGLSALAAREMAGCIIKFHRQRSDRVSIFVTSDERSLDAIESDITFRQKGAALELI